MSTPFTDAVGIIEQLWTDNWALEVPIYWHHNSSELVPSRATADYWIHIAVEFDDELAVAFGQGPLQSERELRGCVVIRVFGGRGLGETNILNLLDVALSIYRGQRVGGLSFIGDMVQQ